jgi:dienelactone hydrolase
MACAGARLAPRRGAVRAAPDLLRPWPDGEALQGSVVESVRFASHSPFSLADVGGGPELDPPTEAVGTLYLPATIAAPVPAVILLHGASGVRGMREQTYGRQLAALGIAALVIDAFAPRRHMGRGFVERILNITETMLIADAYGALRYLAARPEIDGERVVMLGFSYGGMASVLAAYAQVAELFAPDGERFAGHVAYYGPCIARFADPRSTGAPVLMLYGDQDQIMNTDRCAETAADLERGGSKVEVIVYPGARHQWDGSRTVPWRAPRHLADCAVTVDTEGDVRDERTFLPMIGPTTRRIILGLCSSADGYLVARDDAIRARSNRDLGAFLQPLFTPSQG